MKLVIGATLLLLAAGVPSGFSQEPEKDKDKPKPKQEEPNRSEPERRPPQEREKQEKPPEKPPQDKQRDNARQDNAKQDKEQNDRARQADKQREQSEKDRAKQDRATPERSQQTGRDEHAREPHNNVQQARRDNDHGNGRRIRDEDFRSHFGRQHAFRVARRDDRRFQSGGYWFVYNEAWPAEWSYDDDVYVDEIDGEYYLIDPVHPGFRLLVVVGD